MSNGRYLEDVPPQSRGQDKWTHDNTTGAGHWPMLCHFRKVREDILQFVEAKQDISSSCGVLFGKVGDITEKPSLGPY